MPGRGVEIRRRVAARRSCGVDQDVDRPGIALDVGRHRLGRFGADEVGDDRPRRVPRRGKSGLRAFEVGGAARDEHDARALTGESLGAGIADSLAGAGDDDNLVGKSQVHGSPPTEFFESE